MTQKDSARYKTVGSTIGVGLLVVLGFVLVGCPSAPPDGGGGNGNGNGNGNGGGEGPALVGLEANKASILPLGVQAAYNDDTMFFQLSWEGDRGDVHDQVHFTEGAWQNEGWPRRDAQASIDNDPVRGPTNATSTIYESRVTFMLDDPSGPNAVPGFLEFGCTLTCHDNSRAMPLWRESDGEVSKYLNDDVPGTLDLWHHRLARANPIGFSDDQHVTKIPDGGEEGGRLGDVGDSPWQANSIVDGNPTFAFDPATTEGLFAYPFSEVFTSPLRSFARADSAELGPAPLPVGIDFAEAIAMGYVPQEGDTIPRRRLRQPTGSRGDITANGTTFTPSASDPLFGRWRSNVQRLLDTGNPDDTALAAGGIYNIAFAVHVGMVTVRDHYVSFAQTLSLNGGGADIQAVRVSGNGRNNPPDFSNTAQFPVTELNLFLPGITSYEFLTGQDAGLTFVDPATNDAIDQNHAGANALLTQGLSCRACHTAAADEPFDPPQAGGFNAGAMESLAPQRGGVNTPTPIPPGGSS